MCAKKTYKAADYLRYLRDELPDRERHELERQAQSDPFDREALEGLEGLEPEKAEEDLLALHHSLRSRLRRRKRRNWYSIAATAASILIVGTIFMNIHDLNPDEEREKGFTEEEFRTLGAPEVREAEPVTEKAAPVVEKAAPVVEPELEAAIIAEAANEISESFDMEEEVVAVEAAPMKSKKAEIAEKSDRRTAKSAPRAAQVPEAIENGERKRIEGILVSSEDNEPIPGAVIVVDGEGSGTITDQEGRFSVPAEDSQATVVASFIGMETEEYRLEEDTENRLVMNPDPPNLEEVVVVSHSTSRSTAFSQTASKKIVGVEENETDYINAAPEEGYSSFKKYIASNIRYPEDHAEGQKEVVVLKFNVNSNGKIGEIRAIRTPSPIYTTEAIRLLREGPAWKPAMDENSPIDEQVRIRFVFKR